MLGSLDRHLMLLLRQFHLEQIQSPAEALMTLTEGCEGERETHSGMTERVGTIETGSQLEVK